MECGWENCIFPQVRTRQENKPPRRLLRALFPPQRFPVAPLELQTHENGSIRLSAASTFLDDLRAVWSNPVSGGWRLRWATRGRISACIPQSPLRSSTVVVPCSLEGAAMSTDADFIRFDCPGCGKRLKAPLGMIRKQVPCPKCRANVTVPEPQEESPSEDIVSIRDDDGPLSREGDFLPPALNRGPIAAQPNSVEAAKSVFEPEPRPSPPPTYTSEAFGPRPDGSGEDRCPQCGGWTVHRPGLTCEACIRNPERGKCRICKMPCKEAGKLCSVCFNEYGMVKCPCCLEPLGIKATFCPRCGRVDTSRVFWIAFCVWAGLGALSAIPFIFWVIFAAASKAPGR
jgi:hypothetical protein